MENKDLQFNRNAKEIFLEFQLAQRRGLIIELVKEMYWVESPQVQDEIKGLVVFANLVYKNYLKILDPTQRQY